MDLKKIKTRSEAWVHELIFSTFYGKTLLGAAFEMRDSVLLRAFLECLETTSSLEGNQVAETLDLNSTFSSCARMSLDMEGELRRAALAVLSYLMANYARPSADDLTKLSRRARQVTDEDFKTFCLSAVTSAANPFIPGMSLSVALAEAAEMVLEGEKGSLIALQNTVDNLLLEILERLPQTVREFDRGMDGCCAVFEPEYARSADAPTTVQGPLSVALQARQQTETYCNAPLVMDFLSRRFTRGLPNLSDTGCVLKDQSELQCLRGGTEGAENSLLLGRFTRFETADGSDHNHQPRWKHGFEPARNSILTRIMSPRALLQGANSSIPSLTWLPGAQFVVAGLVARPSNYYRVPVMRMMLDLVVYLGTLAVFSNIVIYHVNGAPTWREFIVAAYIVAGCLREGREMWRDTGKYFEDRWNVIDVLGLLLLAAGLVVRFAATSSQWGHGLYALSAPLFFSRILFFAQILRFQGPMIEVIFSMAAELVRFGIGMGVVMLGFAVSFHALFREDESFGETFLDLFKAMLGEVGLFDEFSGGDEDVVATILLVVYLVIMTVMLLNLLVAILSTSHAKVQDNAEREYKASKARIIQHYRSVVDKQLLPAPFNLVQLVVSRPFRVADFFSGGNTYVRVKEAAGRFVFWLVLGPFAVFLGALLWMTSALSFTFVWRSYYSEQMEALVLEAKDFGDSHKMTVIRDQDKGWSRRAFMAVTHLILGMWCLVGAPLCLVALWLRYSIPSCIPALRGACARRMRRLSNYSQEPPPGVLVEQVDRSGVLTRNGTTQLTIEDMLKGRSGGVGADDLRKYLEDPMRDDEVREDQKKRGVTVEHVKLLRNRLERTLDEAQTATKELSEQLDKECTGNKREHAQLKGKLGAVLCALDESNAKLERLEEECTESKQERAEIKSMLASVLRTLDGAR